MLFVGLGFVLWLISVIWLIYLSFQVNSETGGKVIWSIVNLFQPLGGIIFLIVKKVGMIPVILAIIAFLLYGVGGWSAVQEAMNSAK